MEEINKNPNPESSSIFKPRTETDRSKLRNIELSSSNEENLRISLLEIITSVAPDSDLSNLKSYEKLRDQLDLDSMDFLDIVMELRKRYKIEVPKEDYKKLETLDSAVKYLAPTFYLKDKKL